MSFDPERCPLNHFPASLKRNKIAFFTPKTP